MAFYLTVIEGADAGQSFRVEPGECTIGRSKSSTIVLTDESVAWEHVLLREENGRLLLHNLSALGTRVKGSRITEDVRLSSNDEIELSDTCRLRVQQKLGAGGVPRLTAGTMVFLGAVALIFVLLVGGAFWILREPTPPPRRVQWTHWRQAYTRIEERLERWVDRGGMPEEALTVYRDAWRLEQALNPLAASGKWERMRSLLLTLPYPGGDDDTRIVELAGPDSKALRVIMGWDLESSSTDFRWNTDEAYADALVWFVRRRAETCRRLVAEEERR